MGAGAGLLVLARRGPGGGAIDRPEPRGGAGGQRRPRAPDQLRAGGAGHPHTSWRLMGRRSGGPRCSASRCSRSGRYRVSGDFAPTYYLDTDTPLYYYSFTDAHIAMAYRSLAPAERGALRSDDHRLQPGGHVRRRSRPAGAGDLPRRLLRHRRVHASTRSSSRPRWPGTVASLTDPALDRLLDFAAEVGLVVLLHNDVDMPFAKAGRRAGLPGPAQGAVPAPPAQHHHLGARRRRPGGAPGAEPRRHGARRSSTIPALRHVHFDLSWTRGRQVPGGQRRRHPGWRPTSSTATPIASCSAPTRSRPPAPEDLPARLPAVRAAVERARPDGQREGPPGQLRAPVRPGPPARARLGAGQPAGGARRPGQRRPRRALVRRFSRASPSRRRGS